MQAATMKIVNGVNVDRLVGTIEAVQQNPAIADFTFRSVNRWIEGDLTQVQKEEIIKTGCRYSPVYDMMKKAIPEIGIEVS